MECCLFTLFGRGMKFSDIPDDALYDAMKNVPLRPTISNLQWIMGTQYISAADLDLLSIFASSYLLTIVVGGPDRPLSKSQAAQQYAQERQRALAERSVQRSNTASPQADATATQGVFAQMQHSLSERGERLGSLQDRFDEIGEATSEWFSGLSKSAESQKRKMLFSSVAGKYNPFG